MHRSTDGHNPYNLFNYHKVVAKDKTHGNVCGKSIHIQFNGQGYGSIDSGYSRKLLKELLLFTLLHPGIT